MTKKTRTQQVARSAITGLWVEKEYAKENPDTTVVETVEIPVPTREDGDEAGDNETPA